jgi:hypothetical protein
MSRARDRGRKPSNISPVTTRVGSIPSLSKRRMAWSSRGKTPWHKPPFDPISARRINIDQMTRREAVWRLEAWC